MKLLQHINVAVEALRRSDPRAALEPVLEAWRLQRLPRLAMAAERLSARLGDVAQVIDQAQWLKLAEAREPFALPGLLATLSQPSFRQAEERAERLIRWEDPRIASSLLAMLAAPRYRSSGAQWFYERVFKALAAQHDPRVPPALRDLAARYHAIVTNSWGPELANRIRAAATAMEVDDAPEDEATRVALDELETYFETERGDSLRAARAREEAAAREAAIRAQVEATPDDDGLRQVWADTLVEQGDPRGALINLQLMERQGQLPPEQLEQLRVLQSQHRDRLLGAIAPKVVNAVFDRGVAVHVELGRAWGLPRVTEAEWHQVRGVTLPVESWRHEEWAALLAALPSLHSVLRVDPRIVALLAARRPGWVLENALFVPDSEVEDLPPVRHALVRSLALAPLLRQGAFERITLECAGEPGPAVAALKDSLAPRVCWVDAVHLLDPLGWYGWRFELDRAARSLEVRGRFSGAPDLERLDRWWAAFAPLALAVTVRAGERDVAYLPLRQLDVEAVTARLSRSGR